MTGFFDEHGPFERELPTQVFGEVPYVHTAPRRVRRVGRRAAVAAGSLTVGALAAGGAAFAIAGGGDDASVAVSALGAAPSRTAEVTLDPATRTEEASRSELRPGTCVRLDAAALAAVEAAKAPGAGVDGRKVTVRLADGDVSVPVSALKVVRCTVPASPTAPSTTSATSSPAARRPAATSTTSRARTTTRPAPSTTKPRSTTSTRPRTSTTTPRSTTTTKSPTPKPTTTSAS